MIFFKYGFIFDTDAGNKKYSVLTPNNKIIKFGDKRYMHYYDKLKFYSSLNHNSKKRRELYRIRHKNDKINDPEHSGFYSWHFLW